MAGFLSIGTETGGSGGSDMNIQFNQGGTQAGDNRLNWNYTTGTLVVTYPPNGIQVSVGNVIPNVGIQVQNTGTNGSSVYIGPGAISSLYESVHGKTMWYFANNGAGAGIFGVNNGTGSGGFDGNGANIYGQGNGLLQVLNFQAASPGSTAKFAASSTGFFLTNTTSGTSFSVTDTGGNALMFLQGFLQIVTPTSTNSFLAYDNSGYGIMAVCNGSNTGGFNGGGATILANGSTGLLQAVSLQAANGNITTNIGQPYTGFGIQVYNATTTSSLYVGSSVLQIDSYSGSAANAGGVVNGFSARGNASTPTATQSGDFLCSIGGYGWGSSVYNSALIVLRAAENWSGGAGGSYIAFYNTLAGSATMSEKMRLASSGNLLIGQQNDNGDGSILQVTGAADFFTPYFKTQVNFSSTVALKISYIASGSDFMQFSSNTITSAKSGGYYWQIAGDQGNPASLSLADGTGSGGLDGAGGQIFMFTQTGPSQGGLQINGSILNKDVVHGAYTQIASAGNQAQFTMINYNSTFGNSTVVNLVTTTNGVSCTFSTTSGIYSFEIDVQTQTASPTASAGGGATLPATTFGYIQCFTVDGQQVKVPCYLP